MLNSMLLELQPKKSYESELVCVLFSMAEMLEGNHQFVKRKLWEGQLSTEMCIRTKINMTTTTGGN